MQHFKGNVYYWQLQRENRWVYSSLYRLEHRTIVVIHNSSRYIIVVNITKAHS